MTISDLINIATRHGHSLPQAIGTAKMVLAAVAVQTGGSVDRGQLRRLARHWGANPKEVRRRLSRLPLPAAAVLPAITELAQLEIDPTIH